MSMVRTTRFTHRAFRAMGTEILLLLEHAPGSRAERAFDDAEEEMRRLAAIFTRFDDRSELRRLDLGRVRRCGAELVEVLELALDARRRTGGLFDPTVLDALVAAGYDRTFADVLRAPSASRRAEHHPGAGIAVDHDTGIVALGAGATLDLGGIAKGWIADRVAERLADTAPALVDAGGDIACTPRDDDAPWIVDVAGSDLRIELLVGGVASSGTDRRRWIDPASGEARHHLIDPSTATCARADLDRVTAIAPTCADAEVAATSLLLAGSRSIEHLAAQLGNVPYVARTTDGAWLEHGGIR